MPYVNVPNDLSKIKTKLAFNLTKRQLPFACFPGFALKLEIETRGRGAAQPGDFTLFENESHIGMIVGHTSDGRLLVCHCSSGRNNVMVMGYAVTGSVIARPDVLD
ncbi:hypothetical protein SDC9_85265 [bioreactor metagenome]|uniref:NlpC/P60 domain-containing protein n=1 Tax=bioreactor metagenome TaxID=1076179 RepID=A0A644ZCN0_9ZZZZ